MAEESTMQAQHEAPISTPVPTEQSQEPAQLLDPYPTQPSADSPVPPLMNIHADIDMADAAPSPAAPPLNSTPAAQRTATPTRNINGNVDLPLPLPAKAAIHGAPARRYLNEKVTGVLMEGMKRIAVEQYVHTGQQVTTTTF
ncbi:MAG: hypothetical protein Q9181_000337 [Wetmoreana brouardii]